MTNQELANALAKEVNIAGGRTFYVGGYVRDLLLGIENKDIDIEVHGLTPVQLELILDKLGNRVEFGKSFGVYNLKGYSIDIALPRKEIKIGEKHTDFKIDVDPFIGTKKAAERRDFTINSMMKDVLTGEIIDHYNGKADLQDRIIRHVSDEKFSEDPLRVLRACQFAARFEFNIASETVELCKKIDITGLSKERVYSELLKALLKSNKPSIFFNTLSQMNGLDYWFNEVKQMIGICQNEKYHMEGDVYNHTMMVIDQASLLRDKVSNQEAFMLSALTHDFGKAITTKEVDGVYHSYKHELAGLPLVREFIRRLTTDTSIMKYVLNMTKNHMRPNGCANHNASIKATNKLFDESIQPLDLIYLAIADGNGRIKQSGEIMDNSKYLFERYEIFVETMKKPYVTGNDLINAGINPDKKFKEILAYSHKLRLANVNKETALKQTIEYSKTLI